MWLISLDDNQTDHVNEEKMLIWMIWWLEVLMGCSCNKVIDPGKDNTLQGQWTKTTGQLFLKIHVISIIFLCIFVQGDDSRMSMIKCMVCMSLCVLNSMQLLTELIPHFEKLRWLCNRQNGPQCRLVGLGKFMAGDESFLYSLKWVAMTMHYLKYTNIWNSVLKEVILT